MKMKMKAPAILKNKYVLYILLVVALVNVLGYLAMEDYKSLGLFISVGLLSTYFSKNMAVTLLVAILVTAVVAVNDKVKEGLENKKEEKKEKEGMTENFFNAEGTIARGNNLYKASVNRVSNNVPPSTPANVSDRMNLQ